jgi:DNA-binding MarR family transcriptional regulator
MTPRADTAPADGPIAVCNCLALRQAARLVTQLYDTALAPTGLRVTQYSILAELNRRGPASLQDIADALVMDRSTLGHSIRPLQRDDIVRIATDTGDRRARRLELTARGRAALDHARPYWRNAQAKFDAVYGAHAARELRTVMRAVVDCTGAAP